MNGSIAESFGLLLLPIVIFLAGGAIISKLSHRCHSHQRLNMKFGGYTAKDAGDYWTALGKEGRAAERTFLKGDLILPVVLGATLLGILLRLRSNLRVPLHPGWLVLLVAIEVLADSIENLLQLQQISLCPDDAAIPWRPSNIKLASLATQIKLFALSAAYALALYLTLYPFLHRSGA